MARNYSKVMLISLILLSLSFSSAITGKIGNARAIINAEVGETLDRTMLVINDNNVTVNIELFASGDLADDVTFLDNNFTLESGDEKRARFEVEVNKAGTTETSINVKFTEVGKKNGVGMTSTLIIKAEGKDVEEEFGGSFLDVAEDSEETEERTESSTVENETSIMTYLGITLFVMVVLLGVLIYLFQAKQKNNKLSFLDKDIKLRKARRL